jgi:hypothetical protein
MKQEKDKILQEFLEAAEFQELMNEKVPLLFSLIEQGTFKPDGKFSDQMTIFEAIQKSQYRFTEEDIQKAKEDFCLARVGGGFTQEQFENMIANLP